MGFHIYIVQYTAVLYAIINGTLLSCEVSALVQNAVMQQIAVATEQQNEKLARKNHATFVKKPVPADGLCCYHSILANRNYDTWCKIPRHSSGYAKNNRTVKREEEDAQELRELALSLTPEHDELLHHLSVRASERCYVDLMELSWLGQVLNLAIRCTISDEAGFANRHNIVSMKTLEFMMHML